MFSFVSVDERTGGGLVTIFGGWCEAGCALVGRIVRNGE